MSAALRIEDCFNTTPVQKEDPFSGGRSLEAVWKNTKIELVQKLILQFFANRCDFKKDFKDTIDHISIKDISKAIGTSNPTTISHLSRLRENGYLLVIQTSHKKRLYCLTGKIFEEYEDLLIKEGRSHSEAKEVLLKGGRSLNAIWGLDLQSSQKALLLWIGSKCDYSKKQFQLSVDFPYSEKAISKRLSLHEDTLTSLVKNLEKKGLLHVTRSYKTTNKYVLAKSIFINKNNRLKTKREENELKNTGKENELNFSPDELKKTGSDELKNPGLFPKDISHTISPLRARAEKMESSSTDFNQTREIFKEALLTTRSIMRKESFVYGPDIEITAKRLLNDFGIEIIRKMEELFNQERKCGLFTLGQIEFYCRKISEGKNPFEKKLKAPVEDLFEPLILSLVENQELSKDVEPSNEEKKYIFQQAMKSIFVGYDDAFLSNVNKFINEIKPVQLSFFQREYEKMSPKKFEEYFGKIIKKQY